MKNQPTFKDRKKTFEMYPSLKMAYNYAKFMELHRELNTIKKKKSKV